MDSNRQTASLPQMTQYYDTKFSCCATNCGSAIVSSSPVSLQSTETDNQQPTFTDGSSCIRILHPDCQSRQMTTASDSVSDWSASPVVMDTDAALSSWSATRKELSFSSGGKRRTVTSRVVNKRSTDNSTVTFRIQSSDFSSCLMDVDITTGSEASTDVSFLRDVNDSPIASSSPTSSATSRGRSSCVRRLLQAPIMVDPSRQVAAASTSRRRLQLHTSTPRRHPTNENATTTTPSPPPQLKHDLSEAEKSAERRRLFVQSCPTRRPLAAVDGNVPAATALSGSARWRKSCSATCTSAAVDVIPEEVRGCTGSSSSSSVLPKCHSEAEASLGGSSSFDLMDVEHLVGDFSRPLCLPTIVGGKHSDLKAISPETMAKVLNKEYCEVGQCTVVDCRYPYEFSGGHIKGAVNIYCKNEIKNAFLSPVVTSRPETEVGSAQQQETTATSVGTNRRNIIVFHCEFSSERGPKLLRYLRNMDRDLHQDCYPTLTHPEIYLLEGGYREFYAQYRQLCDPTGYMPMCDQRYTTQLSQYRLESKVYTSDKQRTVAPIRKRQAVVLREMF